MTATRYVREGTLAVLEIDNPPVNALSGLVISGLIEGFDKFERDEDAAALVLRCRGRTFVAGGDIAMFDDPAFSPAPFNDLLNRISASPRRVVAELFGTVLGGGLELALACHFRIACENTRFALPEIRLGLIPGSHGTQRLPRLVGLAEAGRMISTGEMIDTGRALEIGLIDLIADSADAVAIATLSPRPVAAQAEGAPEVLRNLADAAQLRIHEPAYQAIAETLAAAAQLPFEKAAEVEADWFRRLLPSAPARAQRYLFFAERRSAEVPGLSRGAATRAVERVGVLGAGMMGVGIALSFALAGLPVTLSEVEQSRIDAALERIEGTLAGMVRRGRLSEHAAQACRNRISGAVGIKALSQADLVIEAVFEDMAIKLDVARELGRTCKPGAIIATNTSTLDVDVIAAATGRPQDVVGTHFFSPAHVMRLLEVVRGRETAADVLSTVLGIARRIGKTVAVSGVCYGFIGNRMAEVYMRESEAMQLEGASPERIDGVIEDPAWLGMAMGPSRMLDMAGVDVGARTVIEWIASGEGPQEPAYRALCRRMFETGSHGQKAGYGYYRYEGRKALSNPAHAALAAELAELHGVVHRNDLTEREIFERLLYPMVNEAAHILAEGIAARGSDIDVVWTAGYGFPRWRGGPLFMADEIGLPEIVARLDHYAARDGDPHGYWQVSPLLRSLAAQGGRISSWTGKGERE
ncbi:3-hydroxyacyl-CoA dehydrogenase [Paracoccus solventivorans]|uniref:3-hydroxyacyl-CoA dehydrogenase n=2 Tax=Paracoccus solventivorans TaxID=53463 RepID=A0A1M7JCC1_9RHOB|nr:3-hydroxyacyl-CoA dehydrogenase [Paracoccus solventivorans]